MDSGLMKPLLRCISRLVLLAALLGAAHWSLPSARAAAPSVRERRVEDIYASFRYGSGGNLREYGLMAQRVFDADTGELLRKVIFAGIVPCHRGDDGIQCRGDLARQRVRRFTVAEDGSRALLIFSRKGVRNRLSFTAGADYSAGRSETENSCGGTTTYSYEYAYNAIAEGSLLGKRVHSQKDRGRSLEHLERYVKTVVCV